MCGSSQPSSTTTSSSELPAWAQPYAKDILAKGEAITDISQNPYQVYGGNRVAGLTDLQNKAISNVSSPEAWGKNVQGYMSPYMQNVVDVQQRNAREQAGAQMGALNAQAAQKGAFGGSGLALQREAASRDLAKQLEGIQASGAQNAFQQGTQQANLANQQQMQYGTLQQQQQQKGLDVSYQDFLNQKNYPYQQLSFMSNLVRGTPMGMNNTSQVYQGPPTSAQLLSAAGTAAYGASKLMASGGMAYADGGEVESQGNIEAIVSKLSDQQLQQALQSAQARGDVDEVEAIQNEMGMRASERNGLASTVTPQMVQRMAGGGILAFDDRGVVDSSASSTESELAKPMTDDDLNAILAMNGEEGGGGGKLRANPQIGQIATRLMNPDTSTYNPTQMSALKKYYYQQQMADAGPNVAAEKYGKYLSDMEATRGKDLEQSKGLAALAAIPALLQPGGTARGLAGGLASFGGAYGQALQADKASRQFLAKAQFEMADAQRKERMGMHKEAAASAQAAAKLVQESKKMQMLGESKAGELLVKQQQANAIAARGAGGAGNKDFIVGPAAYEGRIRELHKDWTEAQIKAEAFKQFQQGKGPGLQGAQEKIDATIAANADKAWAELSRKEKKAFAEKNGIDVLNPSWVGAARAAHQEDFASRSKPSAAPTPTPAPVTPTNFPVTVNGTTYNFPDKVSADKFKAEAGIK